MVIDPLLEPLWALVESYLSLYQPYICNMRTSSGNRTQEGAVQDLLCLVDLYFVYLILFQLRQWL